jgi:hypothetical protein
MDVSEIDRTPSPPSTGERGWGEGAGFPQGLPPHPQYLPVKEVEVVATGGEGPDSDFLGLGDGLQELADLSKAHLPGMAFAVEEAEAAAPVGEGGHGRFAVAALPCGQAQLVEQPGRSGGQRGRLGRWLGCGVAGLGCPPGR